MIIKVNPIIQNHIQGLCKLRYKSHPNGCPNYSIKKGCPPCLLYDEVYNLSHDVYAIIYEFDLASHVSKLKLKHPNWSDRQLKCCLYWQGTARKELKKLCDDFIKEYPNYEVNNVPEALGVNVTRTMSEVGVKLEWMPKNIVRKIAFAAIRK